MNNFLIDSFGDIKALFQQCDENKKQGFYDKKEWFDAHIDIHKLKIDIVNNERFKNESYETYNHQIVVPDFQNRYEKLLYTLLEKKKESNRKLNKTGLKISNGMYISNTIFFTFAEQLYKLYQIDELIKQIFGDILENQPYLDKIQEKLKQINE